MTLQELLAKRTELRANIQAATTTEELDAAAFELEKLERAIKFAQDDEAGAAAADPTTQSIEAREGLVGEIDAAQIVIRSAGEALVEGIAEGIKAKSAELRSGKEIYLSAEELNFIEERAIASSSTLIESKYSRTIEAQMNDVSAVIDMVNTVPLDGGDTWEVAYATGNGEGAGTAEGGTYTTADSSFATDKAQKTKITATTIVNEEVIDLPNANYMGIISSNVVSALRKAISKQIVNGTGTNNQIKGITAAPTTAIPADYNVTITAINEDTLVSIVMGYGNDEDVEGEVRLILNKLTLADFAKVKKSNGDPFYKITYGGTGGTIEGNGLMVPYVISSTLPSHSASTTAAAATTMIYGDLKKYDLANFSGISLKMAGERYIEKGQVGFFGKMYVGGVVKAHKAFMPIKKGGSAPAGGK